MMFRILMISNSLNRGREALQQIIDNNHEIILLDQEILYTGKTVSDHKGTLAETVALLGEIEERGLDSIVFNHEAARKLSSLSTGFGAAPGGGSAGEFQELAATVRKERQVEESILKLINSRLSRITGARESIEQLFSISNTISDLVDARNVFLRENLEHYAELAVVLSLEILEYGKISELTNSLIKNGSNSDEAKELTGDLEVHARIAQKVINDLGKLNESIGKYFDSSVRDQQDIGELASIDAHCLEGIRKEMITSVDTLSFLVDQARKNMAVGEVLERNIVKLAGRGRS
jgi:tRNA isopentenyl-2-thiomethyl-A-37 hydroxylase MiaE